MTNPSTRRRRVAGLLAVITAAASITVATNSAPANAANSGTPRSNPIVMTPAVGTSSTAFKLDIDTTNSPDEFCAGAGNAGWFWHSFITPLAQDPATIDYVSGIAQGPAFTNALRTTGGATGRNFRPDDSGFVFPFGENFTFNASIYSAMTPGSYHIGAACENPAVPGETAEYWSTIITIASNTTAGGTNNFTYSQGLPVALPAAPALTDPLGIGNAQLTATFNTVTANPAVTGYTVTATAGASTFTASGATSPITVPGLTNGVTYNVSVVATNGQGNSVASNVVAGRPVQGPQNAPVVSGVPGGTTGSVSLTWVAPTPLAPNGYSLAVTTAPGLGVGGGTAVAGSPFTIAAGATSSTVGGTPATALAVGLYNFVLTAGYEDGTAVAVPSTFIQVAVSPAQSLQQVIQVERPNGALILTQRCGVNNALGAEALYPGFPGFPAVGAIGATSDQVGTSPDINLTTGGVQPDPGFNDTTAGSPAGAYPFPTTPLYPTRCFINLGTARLLTTGDLAGQYYAANGAMNEVTVVDTREGDLGWTVKGSILSLNNGGANARDTFSGNLVGWSPVVSSTSDPVIAGAYNQVATAGGVVVPGSIGANGLALATGQVLATAAPAAGLGIAVLDARIKVLIPVANSNGIYQGTLTLNAG